MLRSRRLPGGWWGRSFCGAGGIGWGQAESAIVINELHTNPDVKTELVEFIELYNAGTTDVDLSGWQFTEGVLYTFPAGTKLQVGGYLIVAESPRRSRPSGMRDGPGFRRISFSGRMRAI